jgi:hypothetical protein
MLVPWAAAMAVAALLFATFQPGWYSADTAYQWWMVRSGELDSTHPAAMVRLWQLSRLLLPDPQGFFALQLACVWGGLAFVATALPVRTRWRLAVLFAIGLWPAFLALQPHVWKDVWMVGVLLWALGALLREQAVPSWRWRLIALLLLSLAASLRFNALPGVLPLWAWLAWRLAGVQVMRVDGSVGRFSSPFARRLIATFSLPLLLALASLPDRVGDVRPVTVWPIIALWDLAAVSIETDHPYVPTPFLKPGADVQDLARDFNPAVNVPSFATGTLLFYYELDVAPEDLATLRLAWLTLPMREPAAWARHRLRLGSYLFGLRNDELADGSVLMPHLTAFRDNPPLSAAPSSLRDRLVAFWYAHIDGPFFMGWLYALGAALALALALHWRRLDAGAVAASGLTMVLPLLIVGPAADFRYLLWLLPSSLLAWVLLGVGWLLRPSISLKRGSRL